MNQILRPVTVFLVSILDLVIWHLTFCIYSRRTRRNSAAFWSAKLDRYQVRQTFPRPCLHDLGDVSLLHVPKND